MCTLFYVAYEKHIFTISLSFFSFLLNRCANTCADKESEVIKNIQGQIKEKQSVFSDMEAYLPKKNGWVSFECHRMTSNDILFDFWFCSCFKLALSLQIVLKLGPGKCERYAAQQPSQVSQMWAGRRLKLPWKFPNTKSLTLFFSKSGSRTKMNMKSSNFIWL